MLKVNKKTTPEEYAKASENYSHYDEFGYEIKEILRTNLIDEQNHYCPYCERIIRNEQGKCHIEHIKPRSAFSKLSKEYSNLILFCDNTNTCGSRKDSAYEKKFINPVIDEPNEYLKYDLSSGEIYAIDNNYRGMYTIDTLNLNQKNLKEMRRNKLYAFVNLDKSTQLELLDWEIANHGKQGYDFPQMILELKNSTLLCQQ